MCVLLGMLWTAERDKGWVRFHIPKPLVGPCLSAALCFTHRKLPLELPCSAREIPACVQPGALEKSQADGDGAWEKHLAAIQSYLQSCHGVLSGSDVCVPSPGGAQDRDSTWDLTPDKQSSLQHCDKAGTQQGAGIQRNFLFSPGQGSRKMWGWSGAKQPRDQQPRACRGGSVTPLISASFRLPHFSQGKWQCVQVMLSQAFFLPRQLHELQHGLPYPSSPLLILLQGSSATSRSSKCFQPPALGTFLAKEHI